MPWWGWLLTGGLGLIVLVLLLVLGYILHGLLHMFDHW